jgi:hypothetical protein
LIALPKSGKADNASRLIIRGRVWLDLVFAPVVAYFRAKREALNIMRREQGDMLSSGSQILRWAKLTVI